MQRGARRLAAVVSVLLAGVADAIPALAQATTRAETVLDRPRPETDALGIVVGPFLIRPSLETDFEYNDNIYAESRNSHSDLISTVTPRLALQSDWSRHAISVAGSASVFRYLNRTSENAVDAVLAADGRLDVLRDLNIFGTVGFQRLHEDRGTPDNLDGTEPTVMYIIGGRVGGQWRLNRLVFLSEARVRDLNYIDVPATNGTINNDDRDRVEIEGRARGQLDFPTGFGLFVEVAANSRSYNDPVDDNGFTRDSIGYGAHAGVAVELTNLLTGEAFVGYQIQDYAEARFATSRGVAAGANLIWSPTPLTALTLGISRSVDETTIGGVSGLQTSEARLRADHELLRSLLLDAQISARIIEYQGIDRTDVVLTAGVGATYLMNRYARLRFSYGYAQRDSNAPAVDYVRNVVRLAVVLQF